MSVCTQFDWLPYVPLNAHNVNHFIRPYFIPRIQNYSYSTTIQYIHVQRYTWAVDFYSNVHSSLVIKQMKANRLFNTFESFEYCFVASKGTVLIFAWLRTMHFIRVNILQGAISLSDYRRHVQYSVVVYTQLWLFEHFTFHIFVARPPAGQLFCIVLYMYIHTILDSVLRQFAQVFFFIVGKEIKIDGWGRGIWNDSEW